MNINKLYIKSRFYGRVLFLLSLQYTVGFVKVQSNKQKKIFIFFFFELNITFLGFILLLMKHVFVYVLNI